MIESMIDDNITSYRYQSKENPVFGFYTQKSTKDWWFDVFRGSFVGYNLDDEIVTLAFEDIYHNFQYTLLPHASELLCDIKREKTKVCAFTNTDERIHGVLSNLGIDQHFDFVQTSAESGLEKPRLQGFLKILKIADIEEAEKCIHFGDKYKNDFAPAINIGMDAILMGEHEDVPRHKSVNSLKDFHNYLFRQGLTNSNK